MFSMTVVDRDEGWFNLAKLLYSGLWWNANQYVDDCFELILIHAVNCFVWHQATIKSSWLVFSTYMLEKGYIYPQKGNTFSKCIGRWVFFWVWCFPNFSVLTLWSMCSILPASSVWYALHLHRKILCKDHHVQFPSRRVFKPKLYSSTSFIGEPWIHSLNMELMHKYTGKCDLHHVRYNMPGGSKEKQLFLHVF